jgi:hypothetical protein
MSTLLSQIRTWAADLKYWEQSALEKIITGTEITESDYSDLLNACLQDAGLSPISSSRPRLSFPARLIEADQSNKCTLVRMLNLQNVNALPSGQELRFGPNLTLIYGDNGAGKTGYARPLGAAAFTRGDREVLTNAVQPVTRGIPQPGFIYLDNSPVCEKDYKSAAKAREYYSKAIDLPPAEQQSMLQLGFGALRTSYEALVIFGLFNNVVARFEERVRFDALKDVHIETEIVEEIVNRMSILSRYIEAHLHSDSYGGAKPTPAMLLDEIEAFEGIKRRHKSYGQTKQDTRVASPSTERTTTSKGEIGDGKQGQGNRQVN